MAEDPTVDPLLSQLVKRIAALERRLARVGASGALPVSCALVSVTTTPVANATTTQVTLDTIEHEGVAGMADTTNNRILAPASGLYVAIASAEFGARPANGRLDFRIYRQNVGQGLPGTIVGYARESNALAADTWESPVVMRPRIMHEGDAVLLYANHTTAAGNADIDVVGEHSPYLSLFKIGPEP